MCAHKIRVLLVVVLVGLAGGCGGGDDAGMDAPGTQNALEEYSSNLLNSLDKAQVAQVQASLSTVKLEIDRFKQEKGRYPERLDELSLGDIPLHLLSYDAETGEVGLKR